MPRLVVYCNFYRRFLTSMCRVATLPQTLKPPPKNLGYFIIPARGISNIAAVIGYYFSSGALVGSTRYHAPITNGLASITSRLPRLVSWLRSGHSILYTLCLPPHMPTANIRVIKCTYSNSFLYKS